MFNNLFYFIICCLIFRDYLITVNRRWINILCPLLNPLTNSPSALSNVLIGSILPIKLNKEEGRVKKITKSTTIIEEDKIKWWISGFTDGDGWLYISPNKLNRNVAFKIGWNIHREDRVCLENINKVLGLNTPINKKSSEPTISIAIIKHQTIDSVIIPLLDKYPFITIKYYAYIKWKEQYLSYRNNNRDFELYIKSKDTINNYEPVPGYNIPYENINISWLIGFIEAEGSFNYYINPNKTNSLIIIRTQISITQDARSYKTLEAIIKIINSWTYEDNTPKPIKLFFDRKIYNLEDSLGGVFIKPKTTVYNISIQSTDILYYIVLPKLKSQPFLTRKVLAFNIWEIVLTIIIRGLHHTPEGVKLLELLKKNINKYNNTDFIIPIDIINSVINIKPIYNQNVPYIINAIAYKYKKAGVFVFDREINLVIVFSGIKVASRYFKLNKHHICKALKDPSHIINKIYYLRDSSNFSNDNM